MTSIKVNFEIGHEASLRTKKTPEGFTHDWEVFVRGQEGADISHFVEKVVFHLHETFPKPKRVVKEPPFSIKESGYAGFFFPIEIYLKNKEEPKKIKFSYDLTLQQSGSLKDRYIFQNPTDDFKKKLLKGGGIVVNNNAYYTNPDQENRSRDSFTEEKPQLVSKPKLSSDAPKKHKSKEHKEDVPSRTTSSFENLFGPPIHKPPKISPDPKKMDKTAPSVKSEKKDKERTSSDKVKSKHEHKEAKPEKVKVKEEKDKVKTEKVKSHKEERSKEKSSKRPSERPPSPEPAKKKCVSPARRPPSPPPRSNSAASSKDDYKPTKLNNETVEQKKTIKVEPESKPDKEVKEKKKKEKKSHDREKERKEKKEHKKESHKSKDPPKEVPKEIPKVKEVPKEKEKEVVKEKVAEPPVTKEKEKVPKPDRPANKFSIENLKKTPQDSTQERLTENKPKEKDAERKHKHKKKDKKRDESREKHKDSSKDKKHKHEKVRENPPEKPEIVERRETPVPKERPTVPEPASPISVDTASQCSSKSGVAKTSRTGAEDINSSHSDSEDSIVAEEEDSKVKIEVSSPEPVKEREISPEPEPEPEPEPQPVAEPPPPQKEKSKKHKDKSSKREEKKRKRKAAEEEEAENRKVAKLESVKGDPELGESSASTSETKVQDNGVSSSLGEDAEGELSPDYMVQLRALQQRIMTIKSNEELERVVNLIAETGRYEVTTQTFDFDLCLLDRSTVQQLILLVGC